jgi:hypothetical protein
MMPALSFYPAILIAAIFLGWKEAIFILVTAIVVSWFLFVPPAKHVFQRNLGSHFEVELRALPGRRVMLMASDDGPGVEDSEEKQGLGMGILEGLVDQIKGKLTVKRDRGTTVRVDFPIG